MSFQNRRTRRGLCLGSLCLLVLFMSALVEAAPPPAQTCALAKSKATAKKLGTKLKCWQKAFAKGSVVPDPACLAVAEEKFAAAITKAEEKGGCVVTGDAAIIQNAVDSCVDDLVTLTPPAGPACTVSTASFGDEGALAGAATFEDGDPPLSRNVISFAALLEPSSPADAIEITLYEGYGVFAGGPIEPGVYELTGAELNFATCGVCVRLATNVSSAGMHDDDYMATGGTVVVTAAGTAVGQTVSGSLHDVRFHHVHFDDTGETTQANDVCTSKIASATFSATLEAAP